MGSQVTLDEAPRFEVRAVGSFLQHEGCFEESEQVLSPGSWPTSATPSAITRRPAQPDHAHRGGADPTPAANGAQLRTEFDAEGRATTVTSCYADPHPPSGEDGLAPVAERAWSSPIHLDRPPRQRCTRPSASIGSGILHSSMDRADREPHPKVQDEQSLLLSLRAGDEAAFAELVRENAGRLLAVARRMLHSEDDARDALQDAFLQAHRGIARFQGEARLSTWLHRIAINVCLMKLRSRARKPERSIEELLPKFYADGHRIDPGPPWRTEIPDPVESREVRTLVRASIDRLPEIYRSVLLLRDIEEFSTEETAQLLDIKADTVKVRLHRARQALRSLLDPHFAGEAE